MRETTNTLKSFAAAPSKFHANLMSKAFLPLTPLCSCRVLYVGGAIPTMTKDGLQGIQEPLDQIYQPSDSPSYPKGIDSFLSVWNNGLLLEYVDGTKRTDAAFFLINSLHYCAAVRYVVNSDNNYKIRDPNQGSFCNGSSHAGSCFLPLDHPASRKTDQHHPALFALVNRKSTGVKLLECHAFVCSSDAAANELVRACFCAFSRKPETGLTTARALHQPVKLVKPVLPRTNGVDAAVAFEQNKKNNNLTMTSVTTSSTKSASKSRIPLFVFRKHKSPKHTAADSLLNSAIGQPGFIHNAEPPMFQKLQQHSQLYEDERLMVFGGSRCANEKQLNSDWLSWQHCNQLENNQLYLPAAPTFAGPVQAAAAPFIPTQVFACYGPSGVVYGTNGSAMVKANGRRQSGSVIMKKIGKRMSLFPHQLPHPGLEPIPYPIPQTVPQAPVGNRVQILPDPAPLKQDFPCSKYWRQSNVLQPASLGSRTTVSASSSASFPSRFPEPLNQISHQQQQQQKRRGYNYEEFEFYQRTLQSIDWPWQKQDSFSSSLSNGREHESHSTNSTNGACRILQSPVNNSSSPQYYGYNSCQPQSHAYGIPANNSCNSQADIGPSKGNAMDFGGSNPGLGTVVQLRNRGNKMRPTSLIIMPQHKSNSSNKPSQTYYTTTHNGRCYSRPNSVLFSRGFEEDQSIEEEVAFLTRCAPDLLAKHGEHMIQ